jgi:hypothetical protein
MTIDLRVGRVPRASIRGFVVGCRVMRENIPAFGVLVSAVSPAGTGTIYGLIYDVCVGDDPFVRQLATVDLPEEVVRDQRENRQMPIEVSVLAVGHREGGKIRQCLPPQPPVTLDLLHQCGSQEVVVFTRQFDYLRLVLEADGVPVDELLAANLQMAAEARPKSERGEFLVAAGRELVRLMRGDVARLEGIVRRIGVGSSRPAHLNEDICRCNRSAWTSVESAEAL